MKTSIRLVRILAMPTIYKPKRTHSLPYKKHGKQGFIQTLYNSSKWQKLRNAILMDEPLCQNCLANGKTSLATCVHHKHIISSVENELDMQGLAFDPFNCLALCEECHTKMHTLARQRNMKYIDYIKL